MIEAVENHMPEVIVIDEIGTELEALAASTIAQRGVQLVGTAHGVTIESLTKNPCLQILVGGIEVIKPFFILIYNLVKKLMKELLCKGSNNKKKRTYLYTGKKMGNT
jgi:stage III sporulation protein SpoIIIAA